jgi:hypothetical protein
LQRIGPLLLMASLTSCDRQQSVEQNGESHFADADMYVTDEMDATHVPLRPGQAFEVRLREDGTIDQSRQWTVTAIPPHVRQLEVRVVPRQSAADAEATRIFRFATVAEGEGRLAFATPHGRQLGFLVEAANDMVID